MDEDLKTALASGVASIALIAQTISALRASGVLSPEIVNELLDRALYSIEVLQAASPPETHEIYVKARSYVSEALPKVGPLRT